MDNDYNKKSRHISRGLIIILQQKQTRIILERYPSWTTLEKQGWTTTFNYISMLGFDYNN